MEIAKYAEALRGVLGDPKIHHIAGSFAEMADRGVEAEARALYDFLVAKAKEYEAQSVLPLFYDAWKKYK